MYNLAQQHFYSLGYQDGLYNKLQIHGVRTALLADAYADGYIAGCQFRLHSTFAIMQGEMIRLERT